MWILWTVTESHDEWPFLFEEKLSEIELNMFLQEEFPEEYDEDCPISTRWYQVKVQKL